MLQRSFAEVFSAAIELHDCSLGQLAAWLTSHGLPIHRATLGRWRDGTTRPGNDHLGVLQRLPEAMGLSSEEAAQFHRAVGQLLNVPFGVANPHTSSPLAFRRHLGADDLPPFAGRANELAELQRCVLRRESVLISGAGGLGKTRLAQELLRLCVKEFTHGCDFLSLSAGQDSAQIIRNVAHLLGLELQPEEVMPNSRRLALGRLREHVHGVSLLFLLDNVEDADQVRELAQELRAVTWVFTARRASLKRIGVHPLHLRLPATAEAAAIFRAHLPAAPIAIADRDDDRLVCRVVDKVGGLPFALRLAAAVVGNRQAATVAELDAWLDAGGLSRGGSPTKKLERLFDSMLSALPTTAHRTLLLCGVFPKPLIRLIAVQAVGEATGVRPTPDDWATLEDYSLVECPDHEHVALHARLHEHVARRLAGEPFAPAVRAALAAHYLALAENVSLGMAETERDYRPLIGEEPNLLAAADVLHDAGDWSGVQRIWPGISGCLWVVGDRRGYEAFDRRCLTAARTMGDATWAARLLSEIGYVALEDGDWAAAEALFGESQVYYDSSPHEALGRARLRRYRAQAALGRGDGQAALALLDEAERLLADAPDGDVTLARMLLDSARMSVQHRCGDMAAAEAAGRATQRLYGQLGTAAIAQTYAGFHVELGDILYRLGRSEEAADLWATLLTLREPLPHLPEHAEAQARLAWLAAQRREWPVAAELAQAARATFERHGQLARAEGVGRLIEAIEAQASLPGFLEDE